MLLLLRSIFLLACTLWLAVGAATAAADLFVEGEDGPLPVDPALLVPHELVVRHALPVVAEQTWLLDHAAGPAPVHAAALALRARARADLRQHAAAYADLNAALALAPARAEWYRQRGWLAGALGRDDEARADLDTAFRLEPTSTGTARILGLLRFEQGRFADAVAALSFRLEAEPWDPPLPVLHAIARVRAGDEDGRRELTQIADTSQYLEPWPQAIAACLAGRLTREELLAIGRHDTPEPAPVRACQAWFYLGQRAWLDGDAARAARDFRNAVRTGGTSAVEYRLALAAARRSL